MVSAPFCLLVTETYTKNLMQSLIQVKETRNPADAALIGGAGG